VYTEAAIEFCQVLEAYENTIHEDYLLSKVKTTRNKVHPQLFKGFYHELYTTFLFKVNGHEYIPDLQGNNKPYDGFTRFSGRAGIVECKEILADDKIKRINTLYIYISTKLQQYYDRNILISGGNKYPFINGYINLTTSLKNAQNCFDKHLEEFEYSSNSQPLIKSYECGEICIEPFTDGLFENYPFSGGSPLIKFKIEYDGSNVELKLPDNPELIINKIKKGGIRDKRRQHWDQPFEYKIICIGMTLFPFTRFFSPDIIELNENRIRPLLKEDTVAFFILRNFLKEDNYEIKLKVICHPKFMKEKMLLESMKPKFIEI